MSSSVRDRIKAAEQAQGIERGSDARDQLRRGKKLSLNTDEHIKEEFLRRGDGGWHKRVDIGQHQRFIPPSVLPPVIKLTADTPLVATPRERFPGKVGLPKVFATVSEAPDLERASSSAPNRDIPGAFEPSTESSPRGATSGMAPVESDRQRVERLEAEQQAAMDLAAGKARHAEWDRVAELEARQQAEMDAAAILAQAEHDEAEERAKTKGAKPTKRRDKGLDEFATLKGRSKAELDAEAEAMLAEFEAEELARKQAKAGGRKEASTAETKVFTKKKVVASVKQEESAAKTKKGAEKSIPVGRYENLLDDDVIIDEPQLKSRSARNVKAESRHAHVEDEDEDLHVPTKASPREKILFDPVEYQKKKQARQERRASRQDVESSRHLLVEEMEDKPQSRSRSKRSPSILLVRVNDDDDEEAERRSTHRRKHRSQSRSYHDDKSDRISTSPSSHRRSSSFLWPSFSTSERRSAGSILETGSHSRSGHLRTHSDAHSTASTRTEVSVRKLEFAEYIAGKRLDHIPLSPPKSPSRPMGFVRSRSHTGEYSEGYTHDKKLLRKPSDDDEVISHVDHDWQSNPQRSSRHSHSRSKDEAWQFKILQDIVRR